MSDSGLSSVLDNYLTGFPGLERSLLRDQAIDLLRDHIVSGHIPSGTKLVEREVAKLRQELAEREGERGEGPRREELPPTGFSASRSKMVLVGIAIALLVLATMGVPSVRATRAPPAAMLLHGHPTDSCTAGALALPQ